MDLEVLDDGDAHARHVKALHHLLQRERIEPLPVGRLRAFDPRHHRGGRAVVGDCVHGGGRRDQHEQPHDRFACGEFYRNFDWWPTSKSQMDTLLQDLRYAARTLVKNPGFAALTIVCLALGIGVNSTIFSVVDTVAIRPLPFRDPDALVALHTTHQVNGIDRGDVSYLDLQDWKARTRSFADIATVTGRSLTLSDGDEPERFNGSTVTWNMFPMLGVQPILGRQIRPEEDTPGGPRVVLLSHGVWQRRYAAIPSVVGRTITVNGNPHTVIGVMPPKFQFPEQAQLWIPQTPIEHTSPRTARNLAGDRAAEAGRVVRGGAPRHRGGRRAAGQRAARRSGLGRDRACGCATT